MLFPSPGDLPDPGIEPASSQSSVLAGRFFITAPPGIPRGGGACSLSVLRDAPRRVPVEIQLPPESGPDRDGAGAGFVRQAGVSLLCFPGLFTPGSQTAVQGLISAFIKHLPSGYCSATQSCPTLCHPVGCSMPGFPVLHCLLEFAQPAHALLPPSPALSLSQPQGLPMNWIFASSGQSIGLCLQHWSLQ